MSLWSNELTCDGYKPQGNRSSKSLVVDDVGLRSPIVASKSLAAADLGLLAGLLATILLSCACCGMVLSSEMVHAFSFLL
jgi:hypothetical protein